VQSSRKRLRLHQHLPPLDFLVQDNAWVQYKVHNHNGLLRTTKICRRVRNNKGLPLLHHQRLHHLYKGLNLLFNKHLRYPHRNHNQHQ